MNPRPPQTPTRRELELSLRGTSAALAKLAARHASAEADRNMAIRRAVDAGLSFRDVGEHVALSHKRVEQIVRGPQVAPADLIRNAPPDELPPRDAERLRPVPDPGPAAELAAEPDPAPDPAPATAAKRRPGRPRKGSA